MSTHSCSRSKSVIRLSRSLVGAVQEQSGDMWNEKSYNDRFILFPVSMTDRNPAVLPSLLSPQFSHRSPIVFPYQKENWGIMEVDGWVNEQIRGGAKGTRVQVGEDSREMVCVEKG